MTIECLAKHECEAAGKLHQVLEEVIDRKRCHSISITKKNLTSAMMVNSVGVCTRMVKLYGTAP
jgi:hypothetical protein